MAARCGWSLPLRVNGDVLGALNVYSHQRDAFDGSSRRVGEQFAGPASVAIHNARTLAQAQRTAAELQIALTSRSTIDRAVGVVMSRSGLSAEDAFVRLRILSQREHTNLDVIAGRLLEESVHRAQARRTHDEPID